jgi:hypothetical protein
MKNFATKMAAIAATTILSVSAYAFADCEAVQVGVGYRQDSVKWKIDDNHFVNPSSDIHLHFRDMEIFLLGGKVKSMFGNAGYARLCFDYGWVVDGRLRQRAELFDVSSASHVRNGILAVQGDYATVTTKNREKGNSYVWDIDFAIGTPFDWGCGDFQFAPMVGFAYNRQHFNFNHHHRLRVHPGDCDSSFSASFDSESSSCSDIASNEMVPDSRWRRRHNKKSGKFQTAFWGPWIGFDVFFNSQSCWNLYGEFELHFGRAERRTTSHLGLHFLRGDNRTKNFWGPTIRIGGNYNFCECWYTEVSLAYKYWMSYGCHDHLYWSSGTVRFDVGYLF